MKLNIKNTVLIGFAFLSISAFWQMYDNLIPLILTKTFKMNEAISGFIMAADNVLALFLLPIFGNLSDKSNFKIGRRKPFILVGTIMAVIFMSFVPIIDNSYFAAPTLTKLILFIVVLGLLLITMGTYRSPAVALMPDVTPKPLRSKGNAIINLMGAVGGIIYLLFTSVLYSAKKTEGLEHINYQPIFFIVSVIMLIALAILFIFINEPKLVNECKEKEKNLPKTKEENLVAKKGKMPKGVKISLIFMLLSVSLWFIGYNAVSTWFTTYATTVWDMAVGDASLCLTVAMAAAIVSYMPIGSISSKLGRKKVIMFGVVLLASSFFAAYLYTQILSNFHWSLFILFSLVGIAWAAINVNSLPMVVEMCSGAEVGKFTGFYYTFSMAAQTITPIFAGFLLKQVSYHALFPYAAIFSALAFITMCFVKHGDNKIEIKKGIEAFDMDMD